MTWRPLRLSARRPFVSNSSRSDLVGQSKRWRRQELRPGWMEQAMATSHSILLTLSGDGYAGKNSGGERRILVLTIGDGEPSILLLDFDFVPLIRALCVHRLLLFLRRGLHNLSLRLPLLGRGRAHISAACSRHEGLPSTLFVLAAENNLLSNTSTRLQGNTSGPAGQLVRLRMSPRCKPDFRAAAALVRARCSGQMELRVNSSVCIH